MICLKCGFENNEGNIVCTNCGNLLVENTNKQTTNNVPQQSLQTNIVSQPTQEFNTTTEEIQPEIIQQVTTKNSTNKIIISIIAVIILIAGAFGIYKLFIDNPSPLSYSQFESVMKKHGYKVEDTTEINKKYSYKNTYRARKEYEEGYKKREINFFYDVRNKRSASKSFFKLYCGFTGNLKNPIKNSKMCEYDAIDGDGIILLIGNATLQIEYEKEDYDEVLKIVDELGFSKYMKK